MRTAAAILLTAALLTGDALAQQPQQQQPVVTLQLTGGEVAIIGNALGRLPYSEVKPLIDKIQQQLNSQAEQAAQREKDKPNGEKRE